jgi:hypothetical protein
MKKGVAQMAIPVETALDDRIKQLGLRKQDVYRRFMSATDDGRYVIANTVFCIPSKKVANVVAELHEAKMSFDLIVADGRDGRESLVHPEDKGNYAFLLSVDFRFPVVVPEMR